MVHEHLKHELRHIISGKSALGRGAIIQTISRYLEKSIIAGSETASSKQVRAQETARLESFISENRLWYGPIDFSQYISQGAEQKVYLADSEHVLKLNDGIYYASWLDYFRNLLLHNFFFPDTAYDLLGFVKEENILYAVVRQAYVEMTSITNLEFVKDFLASNGFKNAKNNDYFHPKLGLILEDLHDENVLTRNGVLYFIDTVFFLTDEFWNEP